MAELNLEELDRYYGENESIRKIVDAAAFDFGKPYADCTDTEKQHLWKRTMLVWAD